MPVTSFHSRVRIRPEGESMQFTLDAWIRRIECNIFVFESSAIGNSFTAIGGFPG